MNGDNNSLQTQFGISFLRILATLSVIMIHVSGPMVVKFGEIASFDWEMANIYDSVSRYSVPMFFMISGALLLNNNYTLSDFLKKRFGKIVPPFLFWSLAYSLLNRYMFTSESFDLSKIVKDIFYGSEYHLWFVYVLLGVYLFTPILQKWIKNASQKEILYFLLIWLVSLIMEIPGLRIYFPKINLSYFSGFLGYFVLGYYLNHFRSKGRLIPVLMVFLGALITIIGTSVFTFKSGQWYYYFYEYLNLNTLLIASGMFLLFNKVVNSNSIINTIVFKLNQCCFGIYLIHPLVLKLFELMGFDILIMSPILSILLVSLSCFVFCFLIVFCLKKTKYGNIIT